MKNLFKIKLTIFLLYIYYYIKMLAKIQVYIIIEFTDD
jgi:hypothetical protein